MIHTSFKENYIRQRDKMDCGPCCLAMIAGWYGKKKSIEQFRKDCYLSKTGVSLLCISKAAEKNGFRTVGGRLSFQILVEKAILPCIAFWNQNHFVVIYKIKRKSKGEYILYIADPARGLITYNKNEFCEHWLCTQTKNEEKGVVLLLEPNQQFFEGEENIVLTKNRLNFLWKYTAKYKKNFLQVILGIILGSFIQLIFPFLTQSIVDIGIGGVDMGFIWLVLLAQSMLLFSRTIIDFIRNKILLHISTRINISLI